MRKRLKFIGNKQMVDKLGVSKTQIGRWVKCGKLPEPLRLGTHKTSRTMWWEHEVDDAMVAMDNRSKRPE